MGRRKKEPAHIHRQRIAVAAETLFASKGVSVTSMDDIAKAAGYSKATLYVYFQSKEEIIGVLTLKSMEGLYECLSQALQSTKSMQEKYYLLCQALLQYSEDYPFYFKTVLEQINIDMEHSDCPKEDYETFHIGEKINHLLYDFLSEGIKSCIFRDDLVILPTIFSFWGALSGLIQLATNKETYLLQELNQTKQEFLNYGFTMFYRSITKEEYHDE